jgi:predicted DNA-binding transcriptional regulator AlpA
LEFQTAEETLWRTADVARRLSVEQSWVRDHTTRVQPIIPHVKLGAQVRFRKADIEAFIAVHLVIKPTWEPS